MNRSTLSLLLASGAAVLLAAAPAGASPLSEAQSSYRQERAACLSGASSQDRATCLKEAAAALQEARRGNLSTGDLAGNSVERCKALPPADRQDCVMRIQGAGASSGSVRGGGIIRELSRPVATP